MKHDNDAVGPAKKRKGAECPAKEGKGAEGPTKKGTGAPKHTPREFRVRRNVTEKDVGEQNMSVIMEYVRRIIEDPAPFEVRTEPKNGKPGNHYAVDEKKTKMLLMASALNGTLDRDIQNLRAVLYNAVIKHSHIYCSCPLDDAPTLQGRKCLQRHRAGVGFCRK